MFNVWAGNGDGWYGAAAFFRFLSSAQFDGVERQRIKQQRGVYRCNVHLPALSRGCRNRLSEALLKRCVQVEIGREIEEKISGRKEETWREEERFQPVANEGFCRKSGCHNDVSVSALSGDGSRSFVTIQHFCLYYGVAFTHSALFFMPEQQRHHPYLLKPLFKEVHADTETPVSVYLKLQRSYSCLLESVEGEELLARFSYIAIDPVAILKGSVHGQTELEILDEKFSDLRTVAAEESNLRRKIDALIAAFDTEEIPRKKNGSPQMITSGVFGYFGYDAMHLIEKIPAPELSDPAGLPDIVLLFCDTLVIFDNIMRKVFIVSNYLDERDKPLALEKIEQLAEQMFRPLSRDEIAFKSEQPESVVSNTTRDEYLAKVRKAKEYIVAGDIFQVQISQRLRRPLHTRPFDVYRMLRTINPSPYLYYFNMKEFEIVGSSPELLVKVELDSTGRRMVDTRPIAGTRRRGSTFDEDEANARELLADEKELAEHLMLIDLSRNDIGRIAKIGTVETNEMMVIEKYSHVMHIVSNVRGELRDDLCTMDAFWSCFPAGTLTGAPKVRAMEIISELEKEKRGLYGGAVGFLDFKGNLTTAIAIRTMVIHDNTIYFQAAGGIVADSTPEAEYEETINKMKAGITAVASLENLP